MSLYVNCSIVIYNNAIIEFRRIVEDVFAMKAGLRRVVQSKARNLMIETLARSR